MVLFMISLVFFLSLGTRIKLYINFLSSAKVDVSYNCLNVGVLSIFYNNGYKRYLLNLKQSYPMLNYTTEY